MALTHKNILYNSTITAGGNVHIGDKIYVVEEDFNHAILFLQIEKAKDNQYTAQLSIKSPHAKDKTALQNEGQPLLQEVMTLDIPNSLFQQVEYFQQTRRNDESHYRNFGLVNTFTATTGRNSFSEYAL